jgi:pSer/pThr/pTyr-binding forkhead associated (FHA) protein
MVSDLLIDQVQKPAGQKELTKNKEISETAAGRLIVINSSLPDLQYGENFLLDRDIVLGRGGASNIVIKDTFASNQHARIFVRKGQYWLEDMGSTNGTFLNEVQVKQPVVLADGDRLRVGGVTFQFVRWGHEVGLYN